jgi:ubiquinone/menaquinone biosynthesis C-methylase UbiE
MTKPHPNKLSFEQYLDYWRSLHQSADDDLAAVCFPDKPPYFNRFYDRMQQHALNQYLVATDFTLAGKQVLDAGCGRGRWLSYWTRLKAKYVAGIDLSPHAATIAAQKGYSACAGSVVDLPFPNSTFDVVSSITVLLHLPHAAKAAAIGEVARVLKPHGRAILIESTFPDDSAPHVYGLSITAWQTIFAQHNLTLTYQAAHYFNWVRRLSTRAYFIPEQIRDFCAIYCDYPLEYLLMHYFRNRRSSFGLQHLMVFEKMA